MSGENIKLYGCLTSSATKRVRIALQLKHIAYEYVEIDLQRGEHLAPPYSSLNAQKKLPMLIHGHQVFTQSLTIVEYLNEIYSQHDLLPQNPADRAWCRSFASLFAADYHPLITRRVVARLNKLGLSENDISGWKQQLLVESLSIAEETLLQRPAQSIFCCGILPTLADIFLYAHCESARRQGIDLSHYENLYLIYLNCSEIEAFREGQ